MVNGELNEYFSTVQHTRSWKRRIAMLLPLLAILVAMTVFWWLKLTGITLAGEAFCGHVEHVHDKNCTVYTLDCDEMTHSEEAYKCGLEEHLHTDEECYERVLTCTEEHEHTEGCYQKEQICTLTEHSHSKICRDRVLIIHKHEDACYLKTYTCGLEAHIHVANCYSDMTADLETAEIWEATLPQLSPDLSAPEHLIEVARSQIGYVESERNFSVNAEGVRHGYTRYGEWYGNPYGEWSNIFTSFCLRYAGLEDVPINSGAEVMRMAWEEQGLYKTKNEYLPFEGDIVFLDKSFNGTVESTAIIEELVDGDSFIAIEGDVNGEVMRVTYKLTDPAIKGYGMVLPERSVTVISPEDIVIEAPPQIMAGAGTMTKIATTIAYDNSIFTDTSSFVVYTASGSDYYAFDGNGNAVQIYVDEEGGIFADVVDPGILLWSFTQSGGSSSYIIQNQSTGRYMHAYPNNGAGVTTAGAYSSTLIVSGSEVKIRSNSEYARLDVDAGKFVMTQSQTQAAAYRFGVVSSCAVWLDGTNGGLRMYTGAPNLRYSAEKGSTLILPTQWQSPTKYSYALQGWYDVKNSRYYLPGAEIEVTENLVFYADWIPATYDLGQFNAQTSDTVSTNNIITTKLFDYSSLFNVLSANATVNVTASGHSETWNHLQTGTSAFSKDDTLNFIFVDYDSSGRLSVPNNRGSANSSAGVNAGLYNSRLRDVLFGEYNSFNPATGTGIIGKTYLGTGDYLFQFMDNPESEYYGYYYYDSMLHAASYSKTDQRFYVYDYLARTSDSAGAGSQGYSDFLPLNSPYANTNGKNIPTYSYSGVYGEYSGISHFQYEVGAGSADNVGANIWFGMSMEMEFFLPDTPGERDTDGDYGNKDLYGNYMIYQFAGDDDVWVLVDGKLVLDLGGIHGVQEGQIDFSRGVVTVNGTVTTDLSYLTPGDHTLTVYYLERGSSQSNCAMYFNLAPRYSLTIQKEDVLTQEDLDGAEFSVYLNEACTQPAELWNSQEDYVNGVASTNTFRVENGFAYMWGMSPSKTYYIKETRPPDMDGYDLARGIICLTFDIKGQATFDIEMIEESGTDGISGGYTAYGYLIDTENLAAYITITNAQNWVKEITSVQATKIWNDSEDHSSDYVSVYLTITDPDGTVRRIREAVLGKENDWTYTWTNLPKFAADGVTKIRYSIEESYFSGYSSIVEKVDKIVIETENWAEAYQFVNGEKYILKTSNGYLSASSASSQTLKWITEDEAKKAFDDPSSLSTWTATVSGNNVKLVNGNGQILSYNNGNNSSSRYFFLTKSSTNYQNLVAVDGGSGIKLYYRQNSRTYRYMYNLGSNGYISSTTSSGSALSFTPMTKTTSTTEIEAGENAFTVTNTPIDTETAFEVTKYWDTGLAVNVNYETSVVTVKLYANGKDTGRTVTLSLKNGWTDTFRGLPYTDESGNVITYSIVEVWNSPDWEPLYGEVITVNGNIPTYKTSVTNVYRWGHGYELPSTGGSGYKPWVLCGLSMMIGSLICGYILKKKSERRPIDSP